MCATHYKAFLYHDLKHSTLMTMFVHVGYNVDKIIASLQMGQAPRNPQSYPLGEPLAFPTLVKANKPSSMGGRYLSSQESSLTPAGNKKYGQRPPKRLMANALADSIATSAHQKLKKARVGDFFMVRYKSSNYNTPSSSKFDNGGKSSNPLPSPPILSSPLLSSTQLNSTQLNSTQLS